MLAAQEAKRKAKAEADAKKRAAAEKAKVDEWAKMPQDQLLALLVGSSQAPSSSKWLLT